MPRRVGHTEAEEVSGLLIPIEIRIDYNFRLMRPRPFAAFQN
jgi:hypothetical protein